MVNFTEYKEPIAEIAGWTYILEAGRRYTCGGLDAGAKPAVITALAKYHYTELFRKLLIMEWMLLEVQVFL